MALVETNFKIKKYDMNPKNNKNKFLVHNLFKEIEDDQGPQNRWGQ